MIAGSKKGVIVALRYFKLTSSSAAYSKHKNDIVFAADGAGQIPPVPLIVQFTKEAPDLIEPLK
jgi:hypothetical protein